MNNNRGIYWGLFLIAIGVLFGLKNFGYIEFHWSNVFRLWPFLLIFWGVSLLPIKQNIKIALTLLTLISFFLTLIYLPASSWTRNIRFNHNNIQIYDDDYDNEDSIYNDNSNFHFTQNLEQNLTAGKIKMDFGAGEFTLRESSSDLFEFNAHQINGQYSANTEIENHIAYVKIKQKKVHLKSGDNIDIDARLKINPNLLWDIKLDAGAADINMDLKDFMVRQLEIDAGATDIFVEVGNKTDTVNLTLHAGVSNIEIIIPNDMAGEIHTSMVLASRDFIGFDKIEKGRYRTPDFENNPKKVFINIEAAMAAITVRRK
jgi:hypothetical protein